MNNLSKLLVQYGKDHQNPINKAIHLVCIPLILWSLLYLLHYGPTPTSFHLLLTWDLVLVVPCLIYYFFLNVAAGCLMLGIATACIFSYSYADSFTNHHITFGLTVFISAWLGQFLGHKIEGSKPAFFSEIKFLLIGPLWTLNHFLPVTLFTRKQKNSG